MICLIKIQSEDINITWNITLFNYLLVITLIFVNVMALQFCEYLSNGVVLSLLPFFATMAI